MIIGIVAPIVGAIVGFIIAWLFLRRKLASVAQELKQARHSLKSALVRFGKTFEHFIPFIKEFPSDRERFVFLGMPVDGVSFDEDKIRFYEFKTGNSQLSPKQKKIKKMIEEGKVEFKELRYGKNT